MYVFYIYICLYFCIFSQEGKTVRSGGGGFSGKGFKFDESEAMAVSEKKKFQKAALGMMKIIFALHFFEEITFFLIRLARFG